jgi:D-3-phosphoglycerate dehydrogenase
MVPPETLALLRPYANVASAVGKLASQLIGGPTSRLNITYAGEISQHETGVLKAALLGGFLSRISEERVNLVNANLIAQSRGLHIAESKTTEAQEYTNLVTVELPTEDGRVVVSGTIMQGQPHIVRLNEFNVDMVPTGGAWLIVEHTDRPGMIGNIGTVTGDNNINISSMQVSRLQARGPALTVLGIDERATTEQVSLIERIKDVQRVRVVEL